MSRLKAYTVTDGDDGWCIQYATNSASARREGANELNTEWEYIDSCRRSPEFDIYAPGPVPPLALIEHGWWFECHSCSRRIDNEIDTEDEYEPRAPDFSYAPVQRGQAVFCCAACEASDRAKERGNAAARAAIIEVVAAKFPGCHVTGVHVYGDRLEPSEPRDGVRCQAHFKFPGAKHGATWIFGEGNVAHVAQADLDAFNSLYGIRKEDDHAHPL